MPHPYLADVEVTGGNLVLVLVVAAIGLGSLAMATLFRTEVLRAGEGTPKMQEIAQAVQEGANAYLTRQFRTLTIFAAIAFVVLLALPAHTADGADGLQSEWAVRIFRSVFFLVGAGFSAAIGFLGMSLAVRANLRVAAAAETEGRDPAMNIGFRTGAVVGMATVGLGLLGASIVVLVFQSSAPNVLEGFGFGAALLAMFMRVGGGIFTKAADVGADLVGKVEQGIPEDDPRNAATIADNVGDNVGDCAGMAADLFESYAVTLVAALILGSQAFGDKGLVFPLLIPAIGAITAVIGTYLCKPRAGESGLTTINRAFYLSAAISLVGCVALSFIYLPGDWSDFGTGVDADVAPGIFASGAVVIGIVLAAAILALTGYFTGTEHRPVKDVAQTSLTGHATVILSGLSVGLESAVYTAIVIGSAVFGAALLAGGAVELALFAVALAGCGLLTTVGVIVAMDTFGPVSDNAQGIAEMSGDVSEGGAQILTELDAVGNTTKAITKGIAIATAVLAASALFASYVQTALESYGDALPDATLDDALGFLQIFSVYDAKVIVGALLGAGVVFLFSGLAINAVGRAAGAVVYEVRRQFRDIPGIMEGTGRPEYGRVVDIVTRDSLRELATPGILAILSPIAVGFGLGVGPLAGFLVGAIATGTLMAVFLANAGGAWDNAKKLVEDGHHGGKGSEAHAATVTGDTVGDPFKDTAGPAINPLLKVMNLVSLLIVAAVVDLSYGESENDVVRILIALAAAAGIFAAVYISKQRTSALTDDAPAPPAPSLDKS
ncbi:sodium-translocating pyrophosphatase [Nocardioides caeni]|uniref:K(+)-insensitive pyrophosphate-energized proton pump n=1 Tax=Nocardioides caeni TaxID=574700 RepID=A0A4S8N0X8_9ACTN|nr:sodium-translocating pyrophosphatase [Nocardioides caeni]THV09111.1 sodium-translocating pyrophosphatase [Nocardioides caeni]